MAKPLAFSWMTIAIVLVAGVIVADIVGPYFFRPTPPPDPAAQPPRPPYTLRGTVTLIATNNLNYDVPNVGRGCSGQGGYSDLTSGKQVTVTDASGKVIGVGQLSFGRAESDVTCPFAFEVKGVPAADFYGIELQNRGTLRFSAVDMKAKNWEVGIILSR